MHCAGGQAGRESTQGSATRDAIVSSSHSSTSLRSFSVAAASQWAAEFCLARVRDIRQRPCSGRFTASVRTGERPSHEAALLIGWDTYGSVTVESCRACSVQHLENSEQHARLVSL